MPETTASLKISVDSRDVKNSTKDLDNLSKSSSNAENSAKQTTSAFKGLGIVLSTVAAGALAKEFIQTADAMNMLNARLRLVTSSLEEYKSQQTALLKISKDSYSPLADTISLYTKLDPALKRLGASTAGVNQVVDSFSKGLKLGGASAAESSAAMLQFAQAMGSGVLRGDEFNSMMEASPKLMTYVAEGMGKHVTALRKLAEEGKLTAGEVSASMLLMSDKIEADFKTLPKTVSGALTNIKTDLALMVDEINNANEVTSTLANILSDVSITTKNSSDTFLSLGSTVSQTTLDIVDIAKELGSLISAFNDISKDGAGLSLFEAGLTGLRVALDTVYVGLHNSIVIAKELVNTSKDLFSGKETNFLENVNKQILTMDDLVKRYTKSLDDSTKSHTKNNEEIKKGVLDKKAEAKAILAKADLLRKEAEAEKAKEEAAKKAIKAEEDRLKKSHEIAQSQLKMIQEESDKKIKLQEDYYNTLNDIVQKNDSEKLDGLAKEAFDTFAHYDSLIEKYKEVAGAESALRAMQTMAIDTIIEKQKELDEAYNNKTAIDSLDEIYGRYSKLIDAQIELAENGMNIDFNFGDGAKELNNISKAAQQLHVGSLKYTKQDMKLQEDYAKAYLEAGDDIQKQSQLEADFDADNAKLKESQSNAEMAAYSNLAGAMASAFEKGSAGAIAFTTLQSALGIASSWAAIANAWALPFPGNIPAVAMVASAVLPIISQLGGSGGGGGGSSYSMSEMAGAKIAEHENEAFINRLDQQIELLKAIEKNGSAQKLGVERAAVEFIQAKNEWVQDVFDMSRVGWVDAKFPSTVGEGNTTRNSDQWQSIIDYYSSQDMLNPYEMSGNNIRINTELLRTNVDEFIEIMADMSQMVHGEGFSYTGPLGQSIAGTVGFGEEGHQAFLSAIRESFTEIQGYLNDWAVSVVDSTAELQDASETMQELYDSITGTTTYADAKLRGAFADFDSLLRGGESYSDYLVKNINNIERSTAFIYQLSGVLDENGRELTNYELLLSKNVDLIDEQMLKVDEFSQVTGNAFEGGAEEALNYLESIKLVAEAMARSRENIKSFTDSLLTDKQLAGNKAASLGVKLATNVEELASLFNQLAYDTDGLTNVELDLLNANKALLENTDEYQSQIDVLNESLTSVTSSIGTLDGALGTIKSTIEKLRAASRTSEQSLQIYYDAIAEAQRLSTTNLYEDYAKAVSKASDATSALFETSNFTSQRDMDFAQLVAANQFEGLQDITLTEIDYLKQIEVNTRTQIDVLVAAMNSLGSSLSAALAAFKTATPLALPSTGSSGNSAIDDAYQQILGRTPDASGISTWTGEIAAGNLTNASVTKSIAVASIPELYATLLGRAPDPEGLQNWTNAITSGAIQPEQLDDLIKQSAEYQSLNSFAVGTPNVPYDMIAQIHENEMIVPETINQGIQNGNVVIGQNNTDLLVRELNNLNQKQNAIITILQESQNIQNINLQKLTLIEAAN